MHGHLNSLYLWQTFSAGVIVLLLLFLVFPGIPYYSYEGRRQSLLQWDWKRGTKHSCSVPSTAGCCWPSAETNNITSMGRSNNGLLIYTLWSWRWFCIFSMFFLSKRKRLVMFTNVDWHGQMQCNHSELEIADCCKRNVRNMIYVIHRDVFMHHRFIPPISIPYAYLTWSPLI